MSMIRPAEEADVPVILQMIHDLAVYEKEPDAVRNTPEHAPRRSSAATVGVRARWPKTTAGRCRVSRSGS